MVSCSACGSSLTTKNKELGITFHSFPKAAQRKKAWMNFVRKPEWLPKNSSVLCSLHFAQECFDRSSQLKVRLLPTAVPTIEVNRLKYVRTCNPIHTRLAKNVENEIFETSDIVVTPEPTMPVHTLLPPCKRPVLDVASTSTSIYKTLKRKIIELQEKGILKSNKIRRLQELAWRQKKQIASLKSLTIQLKKKHLTLEEHEDILLDYFETNNDLIERLFAKT